MILTLSFLEGVRDLPDLRLEFEETVESSEWMLLLAVSSDASQWGTEERLATASWFC